MANLRSLTPGFGEILHSEQQSGQLVNLINIQLILFAHVEET